MAKVTLGGRSYDVEVRGTTVVVDGQEFPIKLRDDGAHTTVTAGSVQYRVQLPPEGERESGMTAFVDYRPFVLEYEGRLSGGPAPRPASAPRSTSASSGSSRPAVKGAVPAQIAGRIITVKVKAGDTVAAGEVLLLLEAMKMENEIKSPSAGTVKEVLVADGDRVSEGQALIVIE
jgi:glutaconyl-CoA/methylmalonyl-CoA decarboxylase subunit gamma